MSTQEAPTRPVLRYFGAKWRLGPWVLSHFPEHRVYVEPFGGSASVLLQKPRSYGEVYNDLDGEIVNVFRVLRDAGRARDLERALRLTPFSREEFTQSYEPTADVVEQARRTIARTFLGHGSNAQNGERRTGFRAVSWNHHVPGPADWSAYPRHLSAFCERLQGVVIENRPALEVIAQHDGLGALVYADPPYPQQTGREPNAYRHEMTDADHRALAQVLREVSGMVVLSGYPCALYDEELFPDWQRVTRKALADGARERLECLWMNAACVAGLRRRQGTLDFASAPPRAPHTPVEESERAVGATRAPRET